MANINDKRKIRLDRILSKEYIPMFSGRPERGTPINNDDICNLKIMLNCEGSHDVNVFLKALRFSKQ